MIGKVAIAARRPWLATAALTVAIGGALLPTPAVPLTNADASKPTGADDGAVSAEQLTVRAVLRVTRPGAGQPALPDMSRSGGMTTA